MFQNHDFRFRQELEFAAREKKHPTGIDILSFFRCFLLQQSNWF